MRKSVRNQVQAIIAKAKDSYALYLFVVVVLWCFVVSVLLVGAFYGVRSVNAYQQLSGSGNEESTLESPTRLGGAALIVVAFVVSLLLIVVLREDGVVLVGIALLLLVVWCLYEGALYLHHLNMN